MKVHRVSITEISNLSPWRRWMLPYEAGLIPVPKVKDFPWNADNNG